MQLPGKRALVFGGSGGIGRATTQQLLAAGADVVATGRGDPGDWPAASASSGMPGGGLLTRHRLDIGDSAAIAALRDELDEKWGKLDIMVNAAGFTRPVPHADLDGLDDELIDEMLMINGRAQFACCRLFAPMLKRSGEGVIVSISSISASTGIGSNIAYCAAKAGIDVMTKALARVLAPQVRVLAVSPGVVNTDFVANRSREVNERIAETIPLGRIARPEDVAEAVLACCTALRYSTGHTIQVDGGRAL